MVIPTLHSSSGPLIGLLYHSYVPRILKAAVEVNLFETLSHAKMSLSELSGRLKTNEAVTEALLDVLIALDLAKRQDDLYRLTQAAIDFMLKSSGANQLGAVKMYSGSVGPFDTLAEVLLNGTEAFNYRMWTSEEAALGMEQQHKGGTMQAVLSFVKEMSEFMGCKKMCDFAGSIGYFSFAFMQENPGLKSHVYDLPEVCSLAREIKGQEENYDRITFHDFDMNLGESFGEAHDFFFGSNFLYEFNSKGILSDFMKKVNKSMNCGGLFVSSHLPPAAKGQNHLVLSIVELMARCMGYPTIQISESDLKTALTGAGFGQFKTKLLKNVTAYPVLLLSAVKTTEV